MKKILVMLALCMGIMFMMGNIAKAQYIYGGSGLVPGTGIVSETWSYWVPCHGSNGQMFEVGMFWTRDGRINKGKGSNVYATMYYMNIDFINRTYIITKMTDYGYGNNNTEILYEADYPFGYTPSPILANTIASDWLNAAWNSCR